MLCGQNSTLIEMFTNEIRTILHQVSTSLNKNEVDCMLVGGVAVGYYGYQRLSGACVGDDSSANAEIIHDLDFWYQPTVSNYYNLVKAIKELDIDVSSLENIVFDPKSAYLRIPFKTFKTEFLPVLSGLDSYQKSKDRSDSINLDGNQITIINYKDLIANKQSVDREIDRKDIKILESINRDRGRPL